MRSSTTPPHRPPVRIAHLLCGLLVCGSLFLPSTRTALADDTQPTHLPVSFGTSSGACQVGTTTLADDGTSSAQVSVTGVGTCTIQATQPGNDTYAAADPVTQSFHVSENTSLAYTGDTSADFDDSATVSAVLKGASGTHDSVSGKTITFTLGSQTCQDATDTSGAANCTISSTPASASTVSASFAGDQEYGASSTGAVPFTVKNEESTVTYTGPGGFLAGSTPTVSALLQEDGSTPISGRAVTIQIGSGTGARACQGTTNGQGSASCTEGALSQALGPVPITVSFAGDAQYLGATSTLQGTPIFSYYPRGAFVIGDTSANGAVGSSGTVTYWGPKWGQVNQLSGSSVPTMFYGYARTLSVAPPACGSTWTTTPAAYSIYPPTKQPAYMAVIVASQIAHTGNTVTGNISQIGIVSTSTRNARGTGALIALLCPGTSVQTTLAVRMRTRAHGVHPASTRSTRHTPSWLRHRALRSMAVSGTTAQNIQFPSIPDHMLGDAPFTITATSVTALPSGPALPPDPSTVAPSLDNSAPTSVYSDTAYLYTGSNPIQTGVSPGTILPNRVAVLRGKVTDLGGNPLPGVAVTVLDHPEFGQTLTRADGGYDLAVNGGGQITLDFALSGYLPASRSVQAPWSDFSQVDDLAMVPYDSNVTSIDLRQGGVARGAVVSDDRGTRQDTLIFPQGESATYIMPDGSTKPVSDTQQVRITEFTQGPNALQAMPAELPKTSAFTYCVDYSTDEEVALGAKLLKFSSPVVSYHENNLGWPVGTIVPVGSYDQQQGEWIPDDNGLVVRVLDIQNGEVDLDVDGQGQTATPAEYSYLGITDAERTQLATLYQPGQSLWRVPLAHFSEPVDYNGGTIPGKGPDGSNLPLRPGQKPGSSQSGWGGIDRLNQTFNEKIPVAGTPFTLNYASNRTPGYRGAYSVTVPLTNSTVDSRVTSVELLVSVAGETFDKSFAPTPNLEYTYTWDGRDAYGRTVQGSQQATITVRYHLRQEYIAPAGDILANVGGAAAHIRAHDALANGIGYRTFAAFGGLPLNVNWDGGIQDQTFTEWLGAYDPRPEGLSGWTLNIHHTYDPQTQTLYLGDGTQESSAALSNIISTYGGTGVNCPPFNLACDDGKPATQARMYPGSTAVAPDGSVYYDDSSYNVIREIDPDGVVHLFAGGGSGCPQETDTVGDGCPATQASLWYPQKFALGSDGSLYFLDFYNNRIRRIAPNGIITTVAGNGQPCNGCGVADNVPATSVPVGNINAMTVGPDGSVYFDDETHHRIMRVTTDGIQHVIVGSGGYACTMTSQPALTFTYSGVVGMAVGPDGSLYFIGCGIFKLDSSGMVTTILGQGNSLKDGIPATQSYITNPGASSIAIGRDGTIYFDMDAYPTVGTGGMVVRSITPDGIVHTVAGSWSVTPNFGGDLGPATDAHFTYPSQIGVAPDGALLVVDRGNGRIRRVGSPLPAVQASNYTIPSSDGKQLYIFDASGRHLRTVNALTGATVYSFGYDSAGRLTTITDGDGNVTTIEHDSSGNPTAIVGPYGQQTSLAVDGNGYLSAATDPAGAAESLSYGGSGLLQGVTGPDHETFDMTYDSDGYLTNAADPAGGSISLNGSDTTTGRQVTESTGVGYTLTESRTRDLGGVSTDTLTYADGSTLQKVTGDDQSEAVSATTGMTGTRQFQGDPRFGMVHPIISSETIGMPGGPTESSTETASASLSDPSNLLSLTNETVTSTTNGQKYTSSYDAASRTTTTTSPAGRSMTETIDAQGRDTRTQVGSLAPINLTYDASGRISTATQAADSTTYTYGADGYLASLTDPSGTLTMARDADGRLTGLTRPDGTRVRYGYDAEGRMTSVTPPGRPATTLTYSQVGSLAAMTFPDVGSGSATTQYTYNADHQITGVDRPGGQSVALGYDSGGHVATITTPRGAQTFTYTSGGLEKSASDPDGETVTNSLNGALRTGQTWSGPVSGAVTQTYNNSFNPATETVGGTTIAYTYDADSLVTGAGDLTVSRDAQTGAETGATLGVVGTSSSYDSSGFLANAAATGSGNASLLTDGYTRDALGRITQRTETIGGTTHTYAYQYDPNGRLTQMTEDGTPVETYIYDANGNRIGGSDAGGAITATYNARDELVSYNGTAYQYAPDGDLQSTVAPGNQTTTYAYDALSNLTGVTKPDGTVIGYVVDAFGQRMQKLVNGVPVEGFLYDRLGRVVAELNGANTVVSRFVYVGNEVTPAYMVVGGVDYRIVSDQVGSPRLVVNAQSGAVMEQLDYNAFGQMTVSNVAGGWNTATMPFGFAGGLYDADTGLVKIGARDYDPQTGRWTTSDPAGFSGQDTNLYAYAFNDPVNGVDPSGYGPWYTRVVNFLGFFGNVAALTASVLLLPTVAAPLATAGLVVLAANATWGTIANVNNIAHADDPSAQVPTGLPSAIGKAITGTGNFAGDNPGWTNAINSVAPAADLAVNIAGWKLPTPTSSALGDSAWQTVNDVSMGNSAIDATVTSTQTINGGTLPGQ